MARVRWEDVLIRAYIDGSEVGVMAATSIDLQDRMTPDAQKYQGDVTPRLDETYEGVTGTIVFHLEDGFADPHDVYTIQKQHVLDRTTGGRIDLTMTRRRPGSQSRTAIRVRNAVISISERGRQNQPHEVSWDITAETMEKIS